MEDIDSVGKLNAREPSGLLGVDEEEFLPCKVCGCQTDCYDDYGKQDHMVQTDFILTLEIINRLLSPCTVKIFEGRQKRHNNAKCYTLKRLMKDLNDTEEQIRLVNAIISGDIKLFKDDLFEQLKELKLKHHTAWDVDIYDLTPQGLNVLHQKINSLNNDINVIKEIQPVA